ncbi:MAG: hypothetical protein HWN68_19380 [Desulfobacterales bacterium]|nr:hypothetical protein [Desulfobacterales bacterium]
MAVGDVASGVSSIAQDAYLDIRPSAGIEWVIHNVYHEGDIQLEYYDGTNSIAFDTASGMGVYAKFAFHLTNSIRVRVKNTAGETKLIGYDGVVTKSA